MSQSGFLAYVQFIPPALVQSGLVGEGVMTQRNERALCLFQQRFRHRPERQPVNQKRGFLR